MAYVLDYFKEVANEALCGECLFIALSHYVMEIAGLPGMIARGITGDTISQRQAQVLAGVGTGYLSHITAGPLYRRILRPAVGGMF